MAFEPSSDLSNYFNLIDGKDEAECKVCKKRLRNNHIQNLRLHLNKVHSNRIINEKYFEINVLENIAVCRTCNERLKNHLSNKRLHMKKLHNIQLKLPEDSVFENTPNPKPYDEDQIKAVLEVAKRRMVEQASNNEKRSTSRLCIKMNKETIVHSVIGLIVEDGVSPKLVSSKHFDAILYPMCEAISEMQGREFKIDEQEIERIVSSIANYIHRHFSKDLNCRLLSIKIDTDLNASPNTCCVSAVFVDNGKILKRVLGLANLNDDNQIQEEHVKRVLYGFNIDSNQIVSAFYDHTKPKHKKPVKNSEYLKEIDQLKLYPSIFLGDVKIEPYLGSIAQICLLDIFRNSKIIQPFLECRNLVKFISDQTNGYFQLFDLNKIPLPQLDSPWNQSSTCKMMQDLLEARKFLQEIKFEQPEIAEDQFNCNEEFWSFVEAFCKSTNYLQKTILKYYSEELHVGDFYAQWLTCQLLTENLLSANENPNDIFSMILTEVLKSIKNNTSKLLKQERVTACLYLDPRFQHILSADQKTIASEYLKKLWCLCKLYIEDVPEIKEEAQMFDDDKDAYLNEFLSNELQTKDKGNNDVFKKILELTLAFQMADTDILSVWKDLETSHPEVYTLSNICFAIPATEIYNKTLYSHVYRLGDESDLSAFTRENLLNIRLNADMLDDALKHLDLVKDERSNTAPESCEFSSNGISNMVSTSTACSSGIVKNSSTADVGTISGVPSFEIKQEKFM